MRPGRGLVFGVGGFDRRPDPTCQTDLCRQTLLMTPMPYSTKGNGGALARVRVRTKEERERATNQGTTNQEETSQLSHSFKAPSNKGRALVAEGSRTPLMPFRRRATNQCADSREGGTLPFGCVQARGREEVERIWVVH